MNSNKLKLLLENFLIYGLGGIISKIIPFIMVPIVTKIMPSTDYFGIADMSNTVVSFASALAIIGMYDAMYRLFFDKDDPKYKIKVCSTAFTFTLISSIIIFALLLLLRNTIALYFFGDAKYAYIVYLSALATLVGATNSIICAPTRMQNKRKIFLITNTISPLISYGIAIPLLIKGYYTIALPLAMLVSSATMEIVFLILNHKWFEVVNFDWNILKSLLKMAVPLFPNFLIYWVFNSCDRVMITNMISIGAAGVYSVGSKLGHASQLIYIAFAGGWQFFAFSTMKDKNQVKNNSAIFEYLGIISYIMTAFICTFSLYIFRILFKDDYLNGYIVAPYLFLAPLLQMLFQIASNQFLIIKKTWPNMLILLFGAIINVILNYILIPMLGIEGAAIATLAGYIVSDILCVVVLCYMKLMIISKRFLVSSIFQCIYIILWRVFLHNGIVLAAIIACLYSAFIVFLYKNDIFGLIRMIGKKKNMKQNID